MPCILTLLILVIALLLPTGAMADDADTEFENHIRPVLVETCFVCHGGSKVSGALRVDSRDALLHGGDSGPAIVPGSPESSLLIQAIQRHPDVSAMPPDVEQALRPEQVTAFESWIRHGAAWPANFQKFESRTHWAFEPLLAVDLPVEPLDDPSSKQAPQSGKNPIDAFILAKQRAAGVANAPRTDKLTLIRRATFDLTGLPPTPDEVAAFEQDDSPTAYPALVDRLLESPEYGKRWGRHWLDVVRYADTAGETADYPVPLAWRYRNYVVDAFNADKPYDQFLQEQIAGDILASQAPLDRYAEQITATGYLAVSRRFGFDSENYHHLTIQDTIDNLGQTFLGLSLGCARCHDHKFDAVSMQDYYGLYAIFDSSRYAFPGSEQKQKVRALAPLLPPADAIPKWRDYDQRVASLSQELEKRKQPVPTAILRSLLDIDGDFEMQAPAAGGSNGVLVPPWLYEGKIAVTNAAQSPFKNLYARGKVGASIAADTGNYRIAQSLYPRRTRDNCRQLNVNLDFHVAADSHAGGAHRFWIGSHPNSPVCVVRIDTHSVSLQCGDRVETIGAVTANAWHNLQLQVNLQGQSVSGTLATGSAAKAFSLLSPPTESVAAIDFMVLESSSTDAAVAPAIEFDNLGVQEQSISPATIDLPASLADASLADETEMVQQLGELIGMGGDFEFQTEGLAPSAPWNGGPNSVVKVASRSQSSFTNLFPLGKLGVHMPNRAEYDGFGLTLPQTWTNQDTEQLFASFDFRIADLAAGGDGSWRYYIGHGPGNSAAVELFFNGQQLFNRSGDARQALASLAANQWNQVQVVLDLRTKTYTGTLGTEGARVEFQGEFATGWDGSIDYSFIDSYGHVGGVRPALDVDNYDIRDTAILPTGLSSVESVARLEKARSLQQQIAASKAETLTAWQELNRLLADGPYDMAYAMSEGTPHRVRIHQRGEPSQLGDEVPRGFIKALGGRTLSEETNGSGRLELARWLTSADNPLTSRVMVNRIWQYHFGRGLVKTPNDFGVRGLPPTHPELLDFLAVEFIGSGWSVKAMHRLIMQSETYQRSSRIAPTESNSNSPAGSTPIDTRDLYTQFARRRLSAEEIRDSILLVSGELDREPAKEHPFPTPIHWGYSQHGPFTAVYDHNKRSVYLMTQRLKRHPYLALFDGADPNATTADRLGTTVPTQALYFLNDPFIHAKSEAWARRLRELYPAAEQRIARAYQSAFARPATDAEQAAAAEFIAAYQAELSTVTKENVDVSSLAALLRTLLASNEYLYLD